MHRAVVSLGCPSKWFTMWFVVHGYIRIKRPIVSDIDISTQQGNFYITNLSALFTWLVEDSTLLCMLLIYLLCKNNKSNKSVSYEFASSVPHKTDEHNNLCPNVYCMSLLRLTVQQYIHCKTDGSIYPLFCS